MDVHIIVHHWDTPDSEDTEIVAVYQDAAQARQEMKRLAYEEKERVDGPWDDDLTWENDDAVYFGWYGKGCEPDSAWGWWVETLPVQ